MKELQEAIKIIKKLQKNNHYALIVGGYTRDVLMGNIPKDIDIVTSVLPEQIEALFENTKPIGKCFGVILINNDFETATFRQDFYEGDNLTVKLLDPKTHTLEELIQKDALKRDLTQNSIYYAPISDKYYDPVNGMEAIKNRRLNFVGNTADRIKEDPIRLLRVIRFAIKYNIPLPVDTITIQNVELLNKVPRERIFMEITKILLNMNTWDTDMFRTLTFVLADIIQGVWDFDFTEQTPVHHPEGNLLKHTFYALKALRVKNEVTVWATFLHDLGKVRDTKIDEDGKITAHGHAATGAIMAEEILRDLKCSNKFIDEVVYIVKNHMRIKESPKMKKSKVIKMIKNDYYENLLEVSTADSMGAKGEIDWAIWLKEFESSDRCPAGPLVKPLVTGRDLIGEGLKPGETFKILLKKAFDMQLEDELLTKENILLDIFS